MLVGEFISLLRLADDRPPISSSHAALANAGRGERGNALYFLHTADEARASSEGDVASGSPRRILIWPRVVSAVTAS